jgi:hypothetical protein
MNGGPTGSHPSFDRAHGPPTSESWGLLHNVGFNQNIKSLQYFQVIDVVALPTVDITPVSSL